MRKVLLAVTVLVVATAARAEYSEECRGLAQRLAQDPGALKVGELDLVKNCLSGLQRGIVLGDPAPAKTEPVACVPAPVVAPVACKVCPTAEQLCPHREATQVKGRGRGEATPAEDRRLKPYLPKF